MGEHDPDLVALLGSRICHDLISPIGAINNGLELLAMTAQGANSPEMALIEESCRSASARIRFYRVAFGVASAAQRMGPGELRGIIRDFIQGTRLEVDWAPEMDVTREEAKLAFLGILTLETAMPFGGTIRVDESGGRWKLRATANTLKCDPALWAAFDPQAPSFDAADAPSLVQFRIVSQLAQKQGRSVSVEGRHEDGEITLFV